MVYADYVRKVYPQGNVWDREDRGVVWKITKVLGIRLAYLLCRLNVTANTVDMAGIVIALSGFALLLNVPKYRLLCIPGVLLVYIHPFIDFVDGAVARARDETSVIGGLLDDIGPEIDRVLMMMLFAAYTSNPVVILCTVFTSYVLVYFVKKSVIYLDLPPMMGCFKVIYQHPLSPISVRAVLGILPILIVITSYMNWSFLTLGYAVSFFYAVWAIAWIILCLPYRWHGKNLVRKKEV